MPNNIKIEFNPTLHRYTVNGQIFPHVTGIISETVGSGWKAADWYLTRGRAIHQCAKLIAEGKQFKNDPRIDGEVMALKRFWAEVKPLDVKSETMVASVIYKFVGTLDLAAEIDGHIVIIDFKHSVDKVRIPIQLAAYSIAYEETNSIKTRYGYGVHISENGKYTFTDRVDLKISKYKFLALRTTYAIKEECKELSWQKVDKHS